MKKYIFLLFVFCIAVGCRKRLDDFLFANDNSISQYYLDGYPDGELPDLPNSFHVPSNKRHFINYTIKSEGENLEISGVYIGDLDKIAQDTVILYCHGNKNHIDYYWNRQKLLSYVGEFGRFGIFMFDYPGYGLSEGEPSEANVYAATGGALKWLKNQGLTDERLIIYGYSLGSAPACRAVGDIPFALKPNKIILEAPFASSEVMVQDASLLNMPASYFVNLEIDNVTQIEKCTVPLFWLHGLDDDFLSVTTHGKVVYDKHQKSWKQKENVAFAGHNNVPTFMGYEKYTEEILNFITKE